MRAAQSQYGACPRHPDTPRRVGIRRCGAGHYLASYVYCPVCGLESTHLAAVA
jgi:hypothetical protein